MVNMLDLGKHDLAGPTSGPVQGHHVKATLEDVVTAVQAMKNRAEFWAALFTALYRVGAPAPETSEPLVPAAALVRIFAQLSSDHGILLDKSLAKYPGLCADLLKLVETLSSAAKSYGEKRVKGLF